jgi:putative membrane protein
MLHRRAILFAGAALLAPVTSLHAQTPSIDLALGQMGQAETQHIHDTLRMGALALATSKVALEKARHPLVKQFAQFEVTEQQTIAEVLEGLHGALSTTATVGQATNSGAEPLLDDEGRQMLQKLQRAKASTAFDSNYIAAQIDGHQQLLRIQETYLASGKNLINLSLAKLARAQITEHLALLNAASKQTK